MSKLNYFIDKIKDDRVFLKKIFLTAMTRGISALGTFVFNFSLARFLGVSDFGVFMLAYSIIVGLGFIVRYGATTAIMRFGAILFEEKKFIQLKQLRKKAFMDSLCISAVLMLIICLFSRFFASNLFENESLYKMVIIFAFSLPFFSYLTIQSSYLKAFKKPELAPFIEVGLSAFVTGVLVGLLAFIGFSMNITIAAICFLIANIIIFIWGNYTLNKILQKEVLESKGLDEGGVFDFSEYNRSLFDYFTTSFTTYLFKFSPTLILGIFASSEDVGLYSLANSTAFVINFILWIFSTVYAPYFAVLYKQGKIIELGAMLKKSIVYMSFVAVPVFLVIISFPTFLLSLFGEGYIEAKNGLIIMAFAQLFNVLTGPVYFLLNMTGHQKNLRSIIIGTTVVSVVVSFILIPSYGFMGAIISTSIGLVLQNIFSFYLSRKILGIKFL